MFTVLMTGMQALQPLLLVFGGMMFGAIGTALVLTYYWTDRAQAAEERGRRYRDHIKARFLRLNERLAHARQDD